MPGEAKRAKLGADGRSKEAPREAQNATEPIGTAANPLDSMCCAQTAAPEGKKAERWSMQIRGDCTNKNIMCQSASIVSRMLCRGRKHVARKALQSPTTNCGREK